MMKKCQKQNKYKLKELIIGTAAGVDGTKIGGTLFFGTISGGFGAVLTNGNFWQGAATGLIVSGLNHVAHREILDNGYEKDGKDKYKKIRNLLNIVKKRVYHTNRYMKNLKDIQLLMIYFKV